MKFSEDFAVLYFSTLEIRDSVFRNLERLYLGGDAHLSISGCTFENLKNVFISIEGAETTLRIEDSIFR